MTDLGEVRHDGESVYARLRQEILAGELAPGTPLREIAIAERFGVSRTPIREALRRLQHERVLERGTRGLLVAEVSTTEVLQVYDLRILLEGDAAAQAAEARDQGDLLELKSLLARDRALVDPVDSLRLSTNLEFHAAVSAAAHNAVLDDILKRLSIHLIRTPHSTLSTGNRWAEALDEHASLVDAIERRDVDAAREIAAEHMRTARGIRLELLRERH
jgi:DNA-binding GntR family transcriptional regulator